MSGIFPLRQQVDLDEERGPRLVDLDEEVADEVFQALASRTTRRIFGALHESPQTASDLAKLTDTSVQNVQYHLEKLQEADLVEPVDTWYSERGTEMKVYAPTDESLVLFAGRDKQGSLRALLKRLVGIAGVLAPASALVGWIAARVLDDGGDRTTFTSSSGESTGGVQIATDGGGAGAKDVDTPAAVVDAAANADPALLAAVAFLLGGLFVILLVTATWYWKH